MDYHNRTNSNISNSQNTFDFSLLELNNNLPYTPSPPKRKQSRPSSIRSLISITSTDLNFITKNPETPQKQKSIQKQIKNDDNNKENININKIDNNYYDIKLPDLPKTPLHSITSSNNTLKQNKIINNIDFNCIQFTPNNITNNNNIWKTDGNSKRINNVLGNITNNIQTTPLINKQNNRFIINNNHINPKPVDYNALLLNSINNMNIVGNINMLNNVNNNVGIIGNHGNIGNSISHPNICNNVKFNQNMYNSHLIPFGINNNNNVNRMYGVGGLYSAKSHLVNPKLNMKILKPKQLKSERKCENWNKIGICKNGNKCNESHFIIYLDERKRVTNFKTKPCVDPARGYPCQYGNRCNFAHPGEDIRRPMPVEHTDKTYYKLLIRDSPTNRYPFGVFL